MNKGRSNKECSRSLKWRVATSLMSAMQNELGGWRDLLEIFGGNTVHTGIQCMFLPARKYPSTLPRLDRELCNINPLIGKWYCKSGNKVIWVYSCKIFSKIGLQAFTKFTNVKWDFRTMTVRLMLVEECSRAITSLSAVLLLVCRTMIAEHNNFKSKETHP